MVKNRLVQYHEPAREPSDAEAVLEWGLNTPFARWFRPILSEPIGAAKESADVNRERASSGSVKVVVTNQPYSRRHNGLDLVSLLAWFPAS